MGDPIPPTDETPDDRDLFVRMAGDFPVRTAIFTLGPPAFALVQFVNGLLHGGSLVYIGLFAALAVALSVMLTRYHVAVYRHDAVVDG